MLKRMMKLLKIWSNSLKRSIKKYIYSKKTPTCNFTKNMNSSIVTF